MSKTFYTSINITTGHTLRSSGMISGANLSVNSLTSGNLISNVISVGNLSVTAITAGNISTGSLTVTSVTQQNLSQSIGSLVTGSNNTIGSLFTTGGNVGINTTAPPSMLSLNGPAVSMNGPHIWSRVTGSDRPVFQHLTWSTNNISLAFDGYWDGEWTSSTNTNIYQIYKLDNKLSLNYASGSPGSFITNLPWNNALSIVSSGNIVISRELKSVVPSWMMGPNISASSGSTITYSGGTNGNMVTPQNCIASPSTGRVTCTVPGRYSISFSAFGESDAYDVMEIYFRKNGTRIDARIYSGSELVNDWGNSSNVSFIIDLVAGDYLDAFVWSGNGIPHPWSSTYFAGHMIG